MWCWIAPFPSDCLDSWRYGDEGNCERGDNAWIYRWAFYFAPLWFCIFMATVCTIMVYKYVHSIDASSLKYRRPERFSYLNTQLAPEQASGRPSLSGSRDNSVSFKGEEKKEEDTFNPMTLTDVNEEPDENDDDGMDITEEELARLRQTSSQIQRRSPDEDGDGEETSGRFSLAVQPAQSFRNVFGKWKSQRIQYREEYKRTVEVYYQSLFYLGTFYLTHVWSTSNRIVQFANGGTSSFGLTAIHSFFDPLQGFLNYFVYQRPRYLRIRREYPKAGRIAALYRMLRFSFMPDPKEWRDQESTFQHSPSTTGNGRSSAAINSMASSKPSEVDGQ